MDFNLVVVAGRLAVRPERLADSARMLVTVRSVHPTTRVDLLPVSVSADLLPEGFVAGDRVWVAGSLQRSFHSASGRSRLLVAARQVERPAG